MLHPRLGEYLLKHNLVREDVLKSALMEQKISGELLGMILVRNGFLTHKDLVAAILEVNPDRIIREQIFTSRIPPQVLMTKGILLVAENDQDLFVATLSREVEVRSILEPYFPEKRIRFVPASPERIDDYVEKVNQMNSQEGALVDQLLRRALTEQISDVHIMPRHKSYSVLFRYLGVRHIAHEGALEEYNMLVARIKDRARMDLAERRIPQDGGFQVEHGGRLIDMRVATLPSPDGEVVVIRLLDPDRVQPTLDGLGISRLDDWRKGVTRSDGLCLICGPTGSGKTTTLNATVREMDRFGRAVYSVEDPVEYRISFAGQVNINNAVGLDFARAVRAFMRADPDVIILGEIRDLETARNALRAAETGHLVLGTLHTGSIRGAIDRLRDLGVPEHELKYLLRSVLVQRLVRVKCTTCDGGGCPACINTGYTGRTIVSECAYFPAVDDVQAMMHGEQTWADMIEDAVDKYRAGVTTETEILRVFGEEARSLLDKTAAAALPATPDTSESTT